MAFLCDVFSPYFMEWLDIKLMPNYRKSLILGLVLAYVS